MASSDQQDQASFDHPPTFRAAVALAAHKGDQSAEALAERFGVTLVAIMAVHHAVARNWSDDEVTLVEALVDRSWAHIERVRTNEALRRNEAHLLSLFEQTAAGIAQSDLAGRIVSANERYCRMLGRSRAELIGRSIKDVTHPDDLAQTALLFEKLVRDGKAFEIEKRYPRADGSAVWANPAVSLIRDTGNASGDIALAVCLISPSARRPTAARMNSSPCWPMNCAIRWRRSARRPTSCA